MGWFGRWFWAPPREGENSAQTLVRVLGNLFRSAFTVVLLGAAAILAIGWQQNREYAERQNAEAVALTLHVSLYDQTGPRPERAQQCNAFFPLLVYIRNTGARALQRTTISLTVREPGTSTNLLEYPQQELTWDLIIPPGHDISQCYTLPEKYQGRGYVAGGELQSFRTIMNDPEPWMLLETKARRLSE